MPNSTNVTHKSNSPQILGELLLPLFASHGQEAVSGSSRAAQRGERVVQLGRFERVAVAGSGQCCTSQLRLRSALPIDRVLVVMGCDMCVGMCLQSDHVFNRRASRFACPNVRPIPAAGDVLQEAVHHHMIHHPAAYAQAAHIPTHCPTHPSTFTCTLRMAGLHRGVHLAHVCCQVCGAVGRGAGSRRARG